MKWVLKGIKQHAIIILIIIENDGDNVSSCCLILECFVWYKFSFHFGSKWIKPKEILSHIYWEHLKDILAYFLKPPEWLPEESYL